MKERGRTGASKRAYSSISAIDAIGAVGAVGASRARGTRHSSTAGGPDCHPNPDERSSGLQHNGYARHQVYVGGACGRRGGRESRRHFYLEKSKDTDQDTVIDKERRERRDLENRTNRTRQNTRGVQSSFLMLRHLFPMSRTPEEGAHTYLAPSTHAELPTDSHKREKSNEEASFFMLLPSRTTLSPLDVVGKFWRSTPPLSRK